MKTRGWRATGVRSELWTGHPWISRVLRGGIVVGPIAASFGAAYGLSSFVAVPTTVTGAVARWVMIAAAATAVLAGTDRLARRLSPLAALLDLTLTFPDRAPSRFRLALRNGSTRQMRARIDEARRGVVGDTPQNAAERVLELVAALNLHDRITRGHSERVRAYSHTIGSELGLSDRALDRLQWAGLLHDVGKLLVPTSILNKVGPLTEAEHAIVRRHPMDGRGLVTPLMAWLGESSRAVWEHHERWDGGGYPAGLAGTDIALSARIVAVADAFDVMTSARSYKQPISSAQARAELARSAGTHFDPTVVRAFLNISVPRLRRATGPLSWLAQATLFPTSVFSSAAGGRAGLVAATLVGASAGTLGGGVVDDTAARAEATHDVDDGPGAAPLRTAEPLRLESALTVGTSGPPLTTSGGDPPPTLIVTSTTRPSTSVAPIVPATSMAPTVPATTAPAPVPSTAVPAVPATATTPTVTMPELPLPPPPVTTAPVTPVPATVPTIPPAIVTLVPATLPTVTLPAVTLPAVTLPTVPFWILP